MEKPFFKALVDSSFTTFITRRVAKVLYQILMVLIAVTVVIFMAAGLAFIPNDGPAGILLAILSPLLGLLALILLRLGFESAVALVLIAENTGKGKVSK